MMAPDSPVAVLATAAVAAALAAALWRRRLLIAGILFGALLIRARQHLEEVAHG